jgi:hypothetical protein
VQITLHTLKKWLFLLICYFFLFKRPAEEIEHFLVHKNNYIIRIGKYNVSQKILLSMNGRIEFFAKNKIMIGRPAMGGLLGPNTISRKNTFMLSLYIF